MNRVWVLIIGGVFASILFVSLASAYYFPSARTFTQDIIDTYVGVFEPILQALFGGVGWSGLYLFERFLLFLLVMSLVYVILGLDAFELFKKNPVVRWMVAIIVPLIGIRFINFEWLNALLLTYQAFAIVLTTAIPLIVFFIFVYAFGRDFPHMRQILWVLFLGVYVGLWTTATDGGASAAYFWTFVAAAAFLLFDSRIEQYMYKRAQREAGRYWKYDAISRLRHDIDVLTNDQAMDPNEKRKAVERKQKEIQRISKMDIY